MSEQLIVVVARMKIKDGSEEKAFKMDLSSLPSYDIVEDNKGGVFIDYYTFDGKVSEFAGAIFSESVAIGLSEQVEADLGAGMNDIVEDVQCIVTSWKTNSKMPIDWDYS